jgi:hypothetical protein
MLVRPVAKSVTPAGNSTGNYFHCNSLLEIFLTFIFQLWVERSNFTRSKHKINTYFYKIKNETFDLVTRSNFLLIEILIGFFIPNLLLTIILIEICLIFSLQTLLVIIRMDFFPKFKKY